MNLTHNQRRFQLIRSEDETGISGTGIVGEGCMMSNGRVSYTWLSENPTLSWYDNIQAVVQIHGHKGKTRIHWLDPDAFDVEGMRAKIAELEARIREVDVGRPARTTKTRRAGRRS